MNRIKLKLFEEEHIKLCLLWAKNINADQYMSRIFPKAFNGKSTTVDHCEWHVITVNEQVIGTIWLEKEHAVSQSAVLGIMIGEPAFLGQKIGQQAIEMSIRQAKVSLGISEIRLNVRKTNVRAINCYQNCRFRVLEENIKILSTGQETNFYTMIRVLE
jgi:RimJ/RimL family protein N-acetyltransferase